MQEALGHVHDYEAQLREWVKLYNAQSWNLHIAQLRAQEATNKLLEVMRLANNANQAGTEAQVRDCADTCEDAAGRVCREVEQQLGRITNEWVKGPVNGSQRLQDASSRVKTVSVALETHRIKPVFKD